MQNWMTILLIMVFAGYVIYLAWQKKWDQLRGIAYKLMLQAEKAITWTKKGQERFDIVFQRVYKFNPSWLRFFFPESTFREKLQSWYIELNNYLDNGFIDGSAKPPDVPIT